MSIQGLEKLEAWLKAKDFAVKVCLQVLPLLPDEEEWGLSQQLRRSSVSIPANIAEGYGRYYYQDNVRFCYNARGSLEEVLSHIVMAHEVRYLPDSLFVELRDQGEDLTRLLNGYIAYLKRSKRGFNEPEADRELHEPIEEYLAAIPNDYGDSRFSTLDSQGDTE